MPSKDHAPRKSTPAASAPKASLTPPQQRAAKALARTQRGQEIARLYAGGKTLQQIGDMFHLTRERIRQILLEHSFRKSLPDYETRHSQRLARQQQIFDTFCQMLTRYGDPAKAAKAMGYSSYQRWLPRLRQELPIAYYRLREKRKPSRQRFKKRSGK